MKQRNLLTNIFSVLLIISLVAFLLVTLKGMDDGLGNTISYISLPLAIISVACIDIVFPILDNKQRLRQDKTLGILTIVKIVLFIASCVVIGLFVMGVIQNELQAVIIFVILYFAQFFINIDPKQEKIAEAEEDDDDDVDIDDEGDTYADDEE